MRVRNLALKFMLLATIGVAITAVPLFSQSSANLSGYVKDQSGAVIPNVQLKLQNVATGAIRIGLSNTVGLFTFVLVPPGTYRLTAAKSGFSSVVVQNLILEVNANVRHDITMPLAQVRQQVTVAASAVQVNSETASLGSVIGPRETVSLPLNGRDFLQLSELSAGVVPPPTQNGQSTAQGLLGGGRQTETVDISGTREQSEIVMFDGIPEKQFFFGLTTLQPPVDSIAEFKIQEGYFSPQFLAPAVINVVTKSGTNSVHGAVWEFVRNDKLNARNFFETDRGPFRQNQFGFNVGGPAIKNKLFWFGDYEGLRLATSSPGFAIVPTASELAGDFTGSATIYDPTTYNPATGTRQPFPGNVIPLSRISSFAKTYNQFIPEPNSAPLAGEGGANFVGTVGNVQSDNKWDVRGDLDWSASNRFFARVSNIVSKVNNSGLLPHSGLTSPLSGTNAVFGWTHIFSPNVVNEFRAGLDRAFLNSSTPADASGPDYAAELGFHNLGGIPVCNGVPPVGLATFASFGEGNENCEVNGNTDKIFLDNLNIVRGRHSISLGFNIRRINWRLVDGYQVAGAFSFTGQYTGNSVADYLLGDVQTAGGAAGALPTWRTAFWPSVYVNDDFHASTKLTLNMGLGWQYTPAPGEKYDDLWGFNFQTGQMIRCGTQGMPHGCMQHRWLDFAPRFGIAYAPAKNWAVRTSYGIFWDRIPGNEWVWSSTDWPFQTSFSAVSEPNIPTINLSQLFPAPPTGLPGATPPAIGTALFNVGPSNRSDPYIQQWTFSVQHTLPGQILTELAYVGSKGTHLSKRVDANVDPSPPAPGDTRTIQERRPYPQYGFFLSDQGRANSEYEALQASATKRVGHGLSFVSGFTWGKSLDNDSYDAKASRNYRPGDMDKGRSIFDVRYRFTVGAVYELPFGNNFTGVKRQIVSGWQISPIITAQSGLPFQVGTITDSSNTGVSVGLKRPNRICDGNLPDSQRTPQHYFNTGCFTLPAMNTYGNGGVAYLDTDGFNSIDLALSKTFPLTERVRLEFRAEAFNSLNAVNFNQPGSTLGTPTFGVVTGAQAPREFQFALKLLF